MCTLNNRIFYKVRELRDADSGDHAGCHLLVYSYWTAQPHVPVNNILNIIQCFIKTFLLLSSVQNHFHLKYADWTPTSKHKIVATEWQYTVLTGVLLNPLNPELNPICYSLALLAHHFLHVSRIMVKSLPLRLLMSYTYIWSTYSWCF